jgi:hypothetical protein
LAGYEAIAAVGETVVRLLSDARVTGDGFIRSATCELFRKPVPGARPLLTLYLYRVVHAARARQPDRVVGAVVSRPVHTIDLHYLLIPWAALPRDAHVLLGWAMATIAQSPQLPAALLNRHRATPVFFEDESVEFVPDAVSLQDLTNIWEVNKPEIQVSAAYVARSVTLHATQGGDGGPVQSRVFDAETASAPSSPTTSW